MHGLVIPSSPESCHMVAASTSQDLCGFALELRKLAYTMPGGYEDPLIRLGERMAYAAAQHDRGKPATAL